MVLEVVQNSLIVADCLDLLQEWNKNGKRSFIDLVYIDPPFNSSRNYNVIFGSEFDLSEEAFRDTWSNISYLNELEDTSDISPNLFNFLKMLETTGLPRSYISYLVKMGIRCWFIRQMLKDTGSFYYHCDPTMSHYIKIMLDYIFDKHNFRNEIPWVRIRNTGSSKSISNLFPRNHDIILFYSKTNNYVFNKQLRMFDPDEIIWRFPLDDHDGKGPYHWNTLASYSQERLEELKMRKEIKISEKSNVKHKYSYKVYYNQHKGGIVISDLWDDINPIHGLSPEYLGYPTQKPEKLLERIILTSSNEGDLVADLFLGGGTTITVAEKQDRRWLGVDINLRAIQLTQERLMKLKRTVKDDYIIEGIPNSSKALRKMVSQNILGKEKNSKFALEDITVKYYLDGVVGNEKKVGDNSIDGRFIFEYEGEKKTGLVQVTSSAGINHLKSFCSEIGKGTGELGVYISFEDTITEGMIIEAKSYGKIGTVDKIQILTFEDLIDRGKQFEVPKDVLTF